MEKLFLLRYDTERESPEIMQGFLEKIVEVHRADEIPASFFCCGRALDAMENEFRQFHGEVKEDPLFDLQDHSYSHIGLCYTQGKPVEVLRENFEKSFSAHRQVFGKNPVGVTICGTCGEDGPPHEGFDATDKSKAEFEMLVSLGLKMINSRLIGVDESSEFCNYKKIGHPEVMGFPSAYSDTRWMLRAEFGDPMEYILGEIKQRSERNMHMPLMLHDWVAWTKAGDKELTHVRRICDFARERGFQLKTHVQCYGEKGLWHQRL